MPGSRTSKRKAPAKTGAMRALAAVLASNPRVAPYRPITSTVRRPCNSEQPADDLVEHRAKRQSGQDIAEVVGEKHHPRAREDAHQRPDEMTARRREQACGRASDRTKVQCVPGRERVPGVTGARDAPAPAMNHGAIRAFAINQVFEQVRQHAGQDRAAEHLIGLAGDCPVGLAQARVDPECRRPARRLLRPPAKSARPMSAPAADRRHGHMPARLPATCVEANPLSLR